jgi:hypothetical protein
MRLTIVVSDNAVYKNKVYKTFDLQEFGIPSDVRVLQWYENVGELEFVTTAIVNEAITELPSWALAVSEKYDTVSAGNDGVVDYAEMCRRVRTWRDHLLLMCDWTQLPESTHRLSETQLNAWLDYRQALRDIPAQEGFPFNVQYPTDPNGKHGAPQL